MGCRQGWERARRLARIIGIVNHKGWGGEDDDLGGLRAEPAEFIKASRPESFVPERTEDGRPARVLGTERHWRSLTQPHSLSWTNWPYWSSVGMVCKGYSDDDIRKIIGENFLRVAGPIPNERPRGRLI